METADGCACAACRRGVPVAGHCVDIDGNWWHTCVATERADAEARAESSAPDLMEALKASLVRARRHRPDPPSG